MKRGFTMLEIMLAVMILAIMTIVGMWTFRTIVRNWELATEMADNMQRVDYALAQVTSALRSAYFPLDGKATDADGFMLLDGNPEMPAEERKKYTGIALAGRIPIESSFAEKADEGRFSEVDNTYIASALELLRKV